MRSIEVYYGDIYAGRLSELSNDAYEFVYNDNYLSDQSLPAISVNLPKSHKEYLSDHIFPVFTNMLPEGANREALCRINKVDEKDFFGMLDMICGMDTIGLVKLKHMKK